MLITKIAGQMVDDSPGVEAGEPAPELILSDQ